MVSLSLLLGIAGLGFLEPLGPFKGRPPTPAKDLMLVPVEVILTPLVRQRLTCALLLFVGHLISAR